MDQEILVEAGQELVRQLDTTEIEPRTAMWVYSSESDSWKLWLVPKNKEIDKKKFYLILSETISANRPALHELDISSTEMVKENHPAMIGVRRLFSIPDLGSVYLSNNTFNGFFLPNGIVLRSRA